MQEYVISTTQLETLEQHIITSKDE